MNKKGQALVEFIIILPIFLLLLMGTIDMGRILYTKINLESQMNDIISLYDDGMKDKDILKKLKLEDTTLEVKNNNEYLDFNLIKKIDIITPGLNIIFDNPYDLKVKRSIKNVT
ncbi:MAG: pilus assembly protein [Ruminococcus sp.]|nr:pilus assembly protein [Ruminococcus sp.]